MSDNESVHNENEEDNKKKSQRENSTSSSCIENENYEEDQAANQQISKLQSLKGIQQNNFDVYIRNVHSLNVIGNVPMRNRMQYYVSSTISKQFYAFFHFHQSNSKIGNSEHLVDCIMESKLIEGDIDDISFSTDDRALCLDNRHRSSKGLFGKPVKQNTCFNWICWKFFAMGTISVLLVVLISILWRTCESTTEHNVTKLEETNVPARYLHISNISETSNCSDFPWSNSRLPLWVQPDHYILRIHPNVTLGNFSGSVDIELSVHETTDLLILNSKNLNITEVKLMSNTGKIDTKHFKICAEREQLAVPLKEKLQPNGKYTLTIKFSGQLTDKMDGLYRSIYTTADGQRKYVAVTQFESTDARAMIPCWDEPTFKAYFTVKVVRDANMFTLSNMEQIKNETLAQGLVEDTFEKSVKMSTYLLAIVVCDFEKISTKTSNGVLVSVYAPALQISQAQWALDIAVKGLEFYETFFKVKYPLKKLDLISLNDFAAGAMENWGLITFRDTYLLYDPLVSTTKSEESVATVVLHELAHQWFGNLVTMKWWNDLWLNEGFADFLESYATNKLEKDWNLMATFVADNVASAMYLDGLVHTHPISVPVKDPAEIESVFDAISYQKGASVLRMVMGLVGEEKMKESLSDYLTKFKYSNAEGKDLWDAINKHVPNLDGLSMTDFTTNFTQQSGYPIVDIVCKNGKFYANQTRFYFLREEMEKAKGNQTWHIHLTVTTDTRKKITHWMKKEKEISFELESVPKWFKANDETEGFFRVNYEEKNWKALTKQLAENYTVFSASDRAGLMNDAFAFLRVGILDVDVAFDFFNYLTNENARGPLAVAASHIFQIETNLRESETYLPFTSYIKTIFTPVYKRVGWQQSSSHEDKLTQQQILALACKFDVDDCRVQAIRQFEDFLQNKTKSILSDHRAILCGAAVQNDSRATWDTVFKLYNNTKVPSEKLDYLRCLGFSKDPWRLNRLLEMTLDPTMIRPNLMATVVSQVASNINGKYLAWRFIQRRYSEIMKLISSNIMSSVIKSLGSFNTKFDYDQINTFFKDKKLGSSRVALDQTLEGIRINIQFMEMNENKIKKFLEGQGYWKGVL